MLISYCTSCHKRLCQLKQTIEHNLSFTKVNEVELCILAYNDDEVEPYLRAYYADYMEDGRLKVLTHYDDYKPVDGSTFACGYVKNLSHAMASGIVLCNLDADNFIGDWHSHVLDLKPGQVLKNLVSRNDGRSGRIACHKSLFTVVGGYRDVGRSDDGDFILRCLRAGAKLIQIDCNIAPIPNCKDRLHVSNSI